MSRLRMVAVLPAPPRGHHSPSHGSHLHNNCRQSYQRGEDKPQTGILVVDSVYWSAHDGQRTMDLSADNGRASHGRHNFLKLFQSESLNFNVGCFYPFVRHVHPWSGSGSD